MLNMVLDLLLKQIFGQPFILMALIVLIGYIAMGQKMSKALTGSIKASIGILVMGMGSGALIGNFGKLIVAYKLWSSEELVKEKGIEELLRIYVKFNTESENNEELIVEAREWFVKMERNDPEALEIWNWFKEISMIEFERVSLQKAMEALFIIPGILLQYCIVRSNIILKNVCM